ncbi:MAG: sugar transferase [Gammaproteobacteria bacterium]|nr:sugar transferase [Gammaproteobacteria bacterium]
MNSTTSTNGHSTNTRFYTGSKRVIDVLLSGLLMFVLPPLYVIVSVLLRFAGEKNVMFRQRRVGRSGDKFTLLKFTTMASGSAVAGDITYGDDPRVLPVGRRLSALKIDELPQLWNTFLGEMSLVGPRPLTSRAFHCYSPRVQEIVKSMKPGVTGVGSLVFRNEDRILAQAPGDPKEYYDSVIIPLKGQLETWYFAHRSLRIDLLILACTLVAVPWPRSRLHFKLRGVADIVGHSPLAGHFGISPLANGSARRGARPAEITDPARPEVRKRTRATSPGSAG